MESPKWKSICEKLDKIEQLRQDIRQYLKEIADFQQKKKAIDPNHSVSFQGFLMTGQSVIDSLNREIESLESSIDDTQTQVIELWQSK